MVRDHQEVERLPQLGAQPAGRQHLLATGKAEGVLLAHTVKRACIDRDGRVQVGVAEQRPRGEGPAGIGREFGLDNDRHVFGRDPFVVVGVLRECRGGRKPAHQGGR